MTQSRRELVAQILTLPLAWGLAGAARALARQPLVIATGGGTRDTPAGTRGAYDLAIQDGADFLAARLVPTKDGALVVRDDAELSASTDVGSAPQFADRRQSRVIDGAERLGWFTEDFTLAELKTLACGAPNGRRRGDGDRAILTFEELIAVARAGSVRTARIVGVHATLSHPAYFASRGLAIEPRLADAIKVAGYNAAAAAMFVASDDPGALKTMGELTRARRVLSLGAAAATPPAPADLAAMRAVAEAVAVDPALALDLSTPKTTPPTPLIAAAHGAGLSVQAWTVGAFPPPPFRPGDARRLLGALFAAGADAVAGDLAAPVARARDRAMGRDDG